MENLKQRAKKLAIEQRKKGAPLNWAEYQAFIIYKEQFEKCLKGLRTETNDKKYIKILEKLQYYNNELNHLRKTMIKNSVIAEKEKNLFYEIIEQKRIVYIQRLDNLILKMYDTKNQRSIFEEVKNV